MAGYNRPLETLQVVFPAGGTAVTGPLVVGWMTNLSNAYIMQAHLATTPSRMILGIAAVFGGTVNTPGQQYTVITRGIINATTGAAFAVGDPLTCDASGRVVKSTNKGDNLVGYALEAATAADESRAIMVEPNNRTVFNLGDSSIVTPEMFGAKGDGVTDDTAAIQAAINSLTRGGIVDFAPKTYIITNLTITNGYTILAGKGGAYGFSDTAKGTILKAKNTTTGYMLTFSGGQYCGVRDLMLQGRNTDDADQSGIYATNNSKRFTLRNVGVYEMPMFGVNVDGTTSASYGLRIEDCEIFGCQRPLGSLGATQIAALKIDTSDFWVSHCEIGASITSLDTQFRRVGVWIGAYSGAGTLTGVIAEGSDIGFVVESNHNAFFGCRADINFGHGWWLGRYSNGSAQYNRIIGCFGHRNSRGNTGVYHNFYCNGNGGVSNANKFIGCDSNYSSGDGWVHAYGFFDNGSTPATGITGNFFIGCQDSGATTAPYGGGDAARMQWTSGRIGQLEVSGGGTPNVADWTQIRLSDAASSNTQYTDFLGGSIGQRLVVWNLSASGAVLIHSANLRLKGGANRTMTAFDCIELVKTESGWQQIAS